MEIVSTRSTKGKLLFSAVETVYGAITWTLTAALEKAIDGAFTRMLQTTLNISWGLQNPQKQVLICWTLLTQ